MDAKLIDFTREQLQALLNVVVAKIVDEEIQRKEYIKFYNMGSSFYEGQTERLKNYNALCLWRVQILTAIGKVGVQEEINSN